MKFLSMLTKIFVNVDDFCRKFESQWSAYLLTSGRRHREREVQLSLSEMLTITIGFQISGFRNFKAYYQFLWDYHRAEFPELVSYNRFIQPTFRTPNCHREKSVI